MSSVGVLLVDWENLAGAVLGRGKVVERSLVDDLWKYAADKFPGSLRTHLAATSFDPTIRTVTNERLIERLEVRSTKEQADIALTVLAMDYLHQGVRDFILVTGDQDFVHLIERLLADQARVTVVYGDKSRLSAVLRHTLELPGVISLDVDQLTTLKSRQVDSSSRSVISLLELQRRGYVLGGRVKPDVISLLADWGTLRSQDEAEYYGLVKDLTEQVIRIDAAVPGPTPGKWAPRNSPRALIKITPSGFAEFLAVDYLARLLSSRPRGLSPRELRTGPFRGDGGGLLDKSLDSLVALGIARRGADDVYAITADIMPLGYFEQLWRVFACVSVECFRRGQASFAFGQLEGLLLRGGIGQGPDTRAAGRVKESVRYASATGVIDKIAVDGKAHVLGASTPLSRPIEQAYGALYRGLAADLGRSIPKQSVLAFMENHDESRATPSFGFDVRDRDRILRVLRQSGAIRTDGESVTLLRNKWGESLVSSR